MEHEEVKEGTQLWTMVGNKPVSVEVVKKYSELGYQFRRIHVWVECKNTTYVRHAEELFLSYQELKDLVFPSEEEVLKRI